MPEAADLPLHDVVLLFGGQCAVHVLTNGPLEQLQEVIPAGALFLQAGKGPLPLQESP